jgi:hypothetical protein
MMTSRGDAAPPQSSPLRIIAAVATPGAASVVVEVSSCAAACFGSHNANSIVISAKLPCSAED